MSNVYVRKRHDGIPNRRGVAPRMVGLRPAISHAVRMARVVISIDTRGGSIEVVSSGPKGQVNVKIIMFVGVSGEGV